MEGSNVHIKIVVSATLEVPVHREEIYKLIQAENRAAVVSK
ncbi:MAG: carbon storage regulator [Candidatus Marinimicrobia bacterium]|nr:carbon storage regulator [Candidatus Neomarinimicrobiota bacterium]